MLVFCRLQTAQAPLGPTVSYLMGNGYSLSRGKAIGHNVDYTLPFSAEMKNEWIYTSTSPYVFIALRTQGEILPILYWEDCWFEYHLECQQ
jgi:hypothetical protein